MTKLAELVETLTLESRGDGDQRGLPLLLQLRRAVGGDIGGTVSGASSGAPMPLNAGAFELWKAIGAEIQEAAGNVDADLPAGEIVKLQSWWVSFSAMLERGEVPLEQIEAAGDRLQDWAKRIRDHFTAARTREVMVPCPNCGYERITLGEGEMEAEQFALVATITDGEVVVSCRNPLCHDVFDEASEWKGAERLAELGRLTGNLIGAETMRAALHDTEPGDTIMPKPREVVPLDPEKDTDVDQLRVDRIRRIVNRWLQTRRGRDGQYLDLLATIEKRLGRTMSSLEHNALLDHLRAIGAVGQKPEPAPVEPEMSWSEFAAVTGGEPSNARQEKDRG